MLGQTREPARIGPDSVRAEKLENCPKGTIGQN